MSTAPMRLSNAQVNAWRLSRQHLAERARKQDLTRVLADVCGVQAQVLSGASIGIWARVDGVSAEDIQDALWKDRSIVKTWAMRGTLHVLASSDLPLYVAGMKTRLPDFCDWLLKNHGVSAEELERILDRIRVALDGRCLTRAQLSREVAKHARLGTKLQRSMLSAWGFLLRPAAYKGYLCFGPSQAQNVTFVRPDQWLGKWDEPESQRALKTLALRFAAAYSPVTFHDFHHWWGQTPDQARAIMESIAGDLEEVEFEGKRRWIRKEDVEEIRSARYVHSVRLLPSWDCYVMFYHPRELFVPTRYRTRIFRQIQGNAPVLTVDGVAAGVWEKKQRGTRLEIRVDPFEPMPSEDKALVEEEADSLGEFLGLTSQASISK